MLICLRRFFAVLAAAGLAVATLPGTVRAGSDNGEYKLQRTNPRDPDPFRKGAFQLELMSGVLFSIQSTQKSRPNIDYAAAVLRLGYMLDTAYGPGPLFGNDEILLEGIGAGIWVGPGNGLGGASLVYRRNFLSSRRIVPFIDLGFGGIYSDAYHQRQQRALGSAGEFDLQAGAGVRFMLGGGWSIDAEANFRHLSNADFAERNFGTNGIGGLIGASWSF